MDPIYNNTQNTEPQVPREGPYSHYRQAPIPKPDNSPALENAALIMGVCSLLFLTSGFFFFFSGLGIIFALLSRGSGPIIGRARTGLSLSVAALLIGACTMIYGFFVLNSARTDNSLRQQFQQQYEAYINGEDVV